MNDPAAPIVTQLVTILIVAGFLLSAVLLGRTLLSTLLSNRKVPTLLWRDFVLFSTLAVAIVGGYIWLWLGIPSTARPWWWTVGAGILTIIGTWSFAIWEIKRIVATSRKQ